MPTGFLAWPLFQFAADGLLIWEAFVTGSAKSPSHCGDATVAVRAFAAALPNAQAANRINELRPVFSIAGAALLRAGWSNDLGLPSTPSLVIKADLP